MDIFESLTKLFASKDVIITTFEVPDPFDDNYDYHYSQQIEPLDDYDDNKILFIFN